MLYEVECQMSRPGLRVRATLGRVPESKRREVRPGGGRRGERAGSDARIRGAAGLSMGEQLGRPNEYDRQGPASPTTRDGLRAGRRGRSGGPRRREVDGRSDVPRTRPVHPQSARDATRDPRVLSRLSPLNS